jgi:putative ABC transport system permease protein
MMPGPVARAVRGGLTRRRVQTIVIGLVVLVSTTASVLALALVVDSNAPFDHAFAAQRGAHVVATIDSARATPAGLASASRLAEVTAAAGPFPMVTATLQAALSAPAGSQGGGPAAPRSAPGGLPPVLSVTGTVAGRASPGGPVDDLTLTQGHWARRPGQIVLSSNGQTGAQAISPALGSKLTVTTAPGKPRLTVVGYATSITATAGAWVVPAQVAALRTPGAPAAAQMLYRFRSAGTAVALRSDVAALAKALPAGAVTGTQSYLAAKAQEAGAIAPFVPFLVAFGIIAMVMSVLIVANVVSGAVVAEFRRIGILKSIGFTPAQIVAAYTGQVTVPAVAGCLGGVVLGNLLAMPVLGTTASVYAVGALRVPAWVDAGVPVAMCLLVGIAAVLPAARAGRLSAVQAIATGRAPRTGRGYGAHRLLGRLRLPRPVTIGLAAPFARPARTAVTMAAILLGATAVTLAAGLSSSLNLVVAGLSHDKAEPVQIGIPWAAGPGPAGIAPRQAGAGQLPTAAAAQHAVEAALLAQPGTLRYVAQADQPVTVAGLSQQIAVTAFRGNASWTGYDMISGHWYTGPGQVDVASRFLAVTGTAIGDTVTLTLNGRQIPVRIAGQVFDTHNNGLAMVTGWQTLASADRGLAPDRYDVALRPGTAAMAYVQALRNKLGPDYLVQANTRSSDVADLMISLIGALTVLLAVVAGLGVLNTVVLHTRERVHDLGVFKAVGMTPRQTIAMVVCWVAGTGLAAGVIAVPAGIALHRLVLPAMAAADDVGLPASFLNVYHGWELAALALAGAVIAVAGALLPAGWAAGMRTASALHAE